MVIPAIRFFRLLAGHFLDSRGDYLSKQLERANKRTNQPREKLSLDWHMPFSSPSRLPRKVLLAILDFFGKLQVTTAKLSSLIDKRQGKPDIFANS